MTKTSENLLNMNTFWAGHAPGAVEVMCLLSAAAQGHKVRLFCYEKFQNLPSEIEVLDAREVLPEEAQFVNRRTGSPSAFSNQFRWETIRKGFGAWMDADMLFLKPVRSESDYIFGWENGDEIRLASCLVYFKPNSKLADDLSEWGRKRSYIPPWLNSNEKLKLRIRKSVGMKVDVTTFPWGTLGPRMFTHFCIQNGLANHASNSSRFCPVPYELNSELFDPSADIERFITEETDAVHLWNQGLKGGIHGKHPKHAITISRGSFAYKAARELGLSDAYLSDYSVSGG